MCCFDVDLLAKATNQHLERAGAMRLFAGDLWGQLPTRITKPQASSKDPWSELKKTFRRLIGGGSSFMSLSDGLSNSGNEG